MPEERLVLQIPTRIRSDALRDLVAAGFRHSKATAAVIGCSAIVASLLAMAPSLLDTSDAIKTLAVASLLCFLLCISIAKAKHATNAVPIESGLVLWWILLFAEIAFFRLATAEDTFRDRFLASAYGEAAVWVITFVWLGLLSLPNFDYLRNLFSGSAKWLSFFAILAVISSAYSPSPIFSFAWAFKLSLIVLLLHMLLRSMRSVADVHAFFRSTFWGFLALTVIPVLIALASPGGPFERGRNESISPNGVSEISGVLLLVSLVLYSYERRMWRIPFVVFAALVTILAGGKAAIFSTMVAGTFFFTLRKKVAAALAFLAIMIVLGGILFMLTPLGEYMDIYQQSGQVTTLTGRTDLWSIALPAIEQTPILGHGYMASKFFARKSAGVPWDAGHMHNGVLEVLYNNGLIGLAVLLMMNFVIIRDLRVVIRRPTDTGARLFAQGSLALYVALILSGMFNASFGGRPYSLFMMMLALVMVSQTLRKIIESNPVVLSDKSLLSIIVADHS
jgi:O-Antigen ligase